jgi:hypothetical protein
LAIRSQDVQVAVFAAEIDPPVADRRRCRNRFAERGRERPGRPLARQRNDVQAAVQSADDRLIAQAAPAGRSTARRPAIEAGRCRDYACKPKAFLGRQRYTSRPRTLTEQKLSKPGREMAVCVPGTKLASTVSSRAVAAPRRAPRYRGDATGRKLRRRPQAQAESRGIFAAVKVGNQSRGPQPRPVPVVFQEHDSTTCRNDQRLAVGRQIAGTAEMIFPGHASLLEVQPVIAFPAVAGQADHFADEIPCPGTRPVRLDRVDLGADCRKVSAAVGHRGRGKDRTVAADLADHATIRAVQHIVRTGRRAEMQIARRQRPATTDCCTKPGLDFASLDRCLSRSCRRRSSASVVPASVVPEPVFQITCSVVASRHHAVPDPSTAYTRASATAGAVKIASPNGTAATNPSGPWTLRWPASPDRRASNWNCSQSSAARVPHVTDTSNANTDPHSIP